jgi:dipeptidase E
VSGFHEGPPRRLAGLGLLPWSNAVHYTQEPGRKAAFNEAVAAGMAPGYGVGDGAALHFVGTELHEVVGSRADAQAWFVRADGLGGVHEEALAVRQLGEPIAAVPPTPVLVGGEQLAA